ncbi:MAG: alpha/beta hydrolase [Lachnospiraceae bacterium]|nr:alpha/beta hydrolase [Lachnospiraceae bacterium]
MIIISIMLIICLLFAALSIYLSYYSMRIRRQTFEEARKWQEDHYDISFYDELEKKDYTIVSYDGYVLPVQLLVNPRPTDRYILISHGYTDNHYGMLKYTGMYLELGFNVILYDLRGHGENVKTFCTYTVRERKDLDLLISDCRKRYPDMSVFGIHGESLGSATSIAVLEYKPDIDFVVADCGFAEIMNVMKGGLKDMHLPEWMIYPAQLCTRLIYGYTYTRMRPIDSLKDNDIPILFFHGEKDTFIRPFNSELMQKETKGYSELHIIPEATHAASVLTAPEDYRRYTEQFLERIGIKV